MNKTCRKIRIYCPVPVIVLAVISIISGAVHISAVNSASFAEFFNFKVSHYFRRALASVTNLLPFSLAETGLLLIPLLMIILITVAARRSKKGTVSSIRYILSVVSVLMYMYSSFVLCFATGYYGKTLAERLELERRDVSAEELKSTAMYLLEEAEDCLDGITFKYAGASIMPYSFGEMNKLLVSAYDEFGSSHSFVKNFKTSLKPVLISELMTYTHISGVYTYFTGEANVNINFPDYTIPYTAAHEMAHQRGIAPEDEANFVAFLVCTQSDDEYIRYSGYMNMYEYVISALYKADAEMYKEVINETDNRMRCEMQSYNKFFEKYRDSKASDITGAINDSYLKSQGQKNGTKSYGMVVDLAVAYYNSAKSQ